MMPLEVDARFLTIPFKDEAAFLTVLLEAKIH